jgi:hypothetical protein
MRQTKEQVIGRLLANSVYLPENGLRKNVAKALQKMSLADLCGLEVIVKMQDKYDNSLANFARADCQNRSDY